MEYFRLKIFGEVYSSGSYTGAAARLGITQPAVSQNMAELEKELGVTLFTRDKAGGRMIPTPAAEVFMKFARRAMEEHRGIGTVFNPDASIYNKVCIRAGAAAAEHLLPEVLSYLRAIYPQTDFEVSPDAPTPDVVITERARHRNGSLILDFEVSGPANPFVDIVRHLVGLVLS